MKKARRYITTAKSKSPKVVHSYKNEFARSKKMQLGGFVKADVNDPEREALIAKIKAAKIKAGMAVDSTRSAERSRLNLGNSESKLITSEEARRRFSGTQKVDSVRNHHIKYIKELEDQLKNYTPAPHSYKKEFTSGTYPQNMFLGGFFKKAGRFVKNNAGTLATIAAGTLLPGVGGAIASSLIPMLIKDKSQSPKVETSADALDSVGNTSNLKYIKEQNETYGQSSYGSSFRNGGKLPMSSLKEYALGGKVKPIGNGAVEFVGADHEQGGIKLPGLNAEVEGGETLDIVINKKGGVSSSKGEPFVFSKSLTVPGSNVSFAKAHKEYVNRGAGQDEISDLAHRQEMIAGSLRKEGSQAKMFWGGVIKGAGKLLPYVPGIVNMVKGATQKTEYAKYDPIDRSSLNILNAEKSRIARESNEIDLDPTSALNDNSRILRSIFADRNASDASKAAAIAGTQQNNASIRSQYAENEATYNAQARERKSANLLNLNTNIASQLTSFNQIDQQGKYQNEQERLAAKAAKANLLNTGLTQIGQTFADNRSERLNRESDLEGVRILSAGADPAAVNRLYPKKAYNPNFSFNPRLSSSSSRAFGPSRNFKSKQ